MSRALRPKCVGSTVYGPHHVSVEHGYTVICPGGTVAYFCDTDCLERFLSERRDRPMVEALRARRTAS
jgi:hypothetical protein